MHRFSTPFLLATASPALLCATFTGESTLAGDWTFQAIETPSTFVFNPGGDSGFDESFVEATFLANGTISVEMEGETEVLPFNEIAPGVFVIETDIEFFANDVGDFWVSSAFFGDPMGPRGDYEFGAAVRAPASLALADLVGTWVGVTFETSADDQFDPSGNLDGLDSFGAQEVSLTINANGTFLLEREFNIPGTITVPDNRSFVSQFTIPGEGPASITTYVNAAKDVAVSYFSPEDSFQELSVYVKPANNLTISDLVGTWRFVIQSVPTTLLAPDEQSFINIDEFDRTIGSITFRADGTAVGSDGDGPFLASYTVDPAGFISITTDDDPEPVLLGVNASKNVAIGGEEDSVEASIIIATKSNLLTQPEETFLNERSNLFFEISGGDLDVIFNNAAGRFLERSLTGRADDWQTIFEDDNDYTEPATPDRLFIRVQEY